MDIQTRGRLLCHSKRKLSMVMSDVDALIIVRGRSKQLHVALNAKSGTSCEICRLKVLMQASIVQMGIGTGKERHVRNLVAIEHACLKRATDMQRF